MGLGAKALLLNMPDVNGVNAVKSGITDATVRRVVFVAVRIGGLGRRWRLSMSITNLIYEAVRASRTDRPLPEGYLWRGSSIGFCLRQQLLSARGVPILNPFPDHAQLKMLAGTFIADFLAEKVKVPVLAAEVPVLVPELRAAGNIDWLMQDGEDVVGVELKSVDSRSFAYSKKEHGYERAQDHQFAQTGFYDLLCSMQPDTWMFPKPDRWTVLLVGRNEFHIVESPLPRVWREWCLKRLRRLNEAYDNDWLLECDCGEGPKWKKSGCAYLDAETGECCSESLFEKVRA